MLIRQDVWPKFGRKMETYSSLKVCEFLFRMNTYWEDYIWAPLRERIIYISYLNTFWSAIEKCALVFRRPATRAQEILTIIWISFERNVIFYNKTRFWQFPIGIIAIMISAYLHKAKISKRASLASLDSTHDNFGLFSIKTASLASSASNKSAIYADYTICATPAYMPIFQRQIYLNECTYQSIGSPLMIELMILKN